MRHSPGYWTPETTGFESIKYPTRRQFKLGSNKAYQAALRGGWLDEICKHMSNPQKPSGYWDFIRVHTEALKYKTRNDFRVYSMSAYKVAIEKNWIDVVCSHMVPQGNRKKRIIYEIADHINKIVYIGLTFSLQTRQSQHRSKEFFSKIFDRDVELVPLTGPLPIDAAIKQESFFVGHYKLMGYNVLNKAKTGSLGGGYRKWSDEDIINEARKYATKTDFKKACKGMYAAAFDRGIADSVFAHMPKRAMKSK